MTDSIGEYIHLHGENYRKYGIGRKTKVTGIKHPTLKLRTLGQASIAKLLENKFNKFVMDALTQGQASDERDYLGMIKYISNTMEGNLNEAAREAINRLQKILNSDISSGLLSLSTPNANTKSHKKSTVEKYKKNLERIIKKLDLILKEASVMLSILEKEILEWDNITSEAQALLDEMNNLLNSWNENSAISNEKILKVEGTEHLLKDCMTTIRRLSRGCIDYDKKTKGLLEEMFISVITSVTLASAEKAKTEVISEVVGKDPIKQIYPIGKNFLAKLDVMLKGTYELNRGKNNALSYYSQLLSDSGTVSFRGDVSGKIDVFYTAPDTQFTNLRLSVKDYASRNNSIKLVDSSPLLNLLYNATNTNFVNHFLNVRAIHTDTKIEDSKIEAEAERAIKIEALTGSSLEYKNKSGSAFANYLVYKGSGKNPYKVRAMSSIINNLNAITLSGNYRDSIPNDRVPAKGSSDRPSADAADFRIATLLNAAWKIKVSAHLNLL